MLAKTFYKKQDYNKATYHSIKQGKQLDCVLMSGALFRHCRDAEATGQIDMNGDRKAVTARIEIPMNQKNQQILRPARTLQKNRAEAVTTNSTGTSTRDTHTKHTRNKPSTRPAPTRRPTTQNNDHDESLPRRVQKRNTTPNTK